MSNEDKGDRREAVPLMALKFCWMSRSSYFFLLQSLESKSWRTEKQWVVEGTLYAIHFIFNSIGTFAFISTT